MENGKLRIEKWKARAIALATELREVRRLLGEFKRENARKGETDMTTEKDHRIYYQNLVYATCAALDRLMGNTPGGGIVCGTADTPTTQVQEALDWLVRGGAEVSVENEKTPTRGPDERPRTKHYAMRCGDEAGNEVRIDWFDNPDSGVQVDLVELHLVYRKPCVFCLHQK